MGISRQKNDKLDDIGEITTDEAMDIVRPHCIFDIHKIQERELRRITNSLIAQSRDEKGIRKHFNYKDQDGLSIYINIDTTKDMDALNRVEKQINAKYSGLSRSKKKIKRRKRELSGQLALFGQARE